MSSRTPTSTAGWGLAGLIVGMTGLAASLIASAALGRRLDPVVAVAETVIRFTPGQIAERLISLVGTLDKPLLVIGILLVLAGVFWVLGRAARRSTVIPLVAFLVLAGIGAAAVLFRSTGGGLLDVVPVVVGAVVWMVALPWLTGPLRVDEVDPDARRLFLARAGGLALLAVAGGVAGQFLGRGRRAVEQTRELLRLPISLPAPPRDSDLDVPGAPPWQTPNRRFYLIDTAITKPAIDPKEWRLRIHGMVENELEFTYDDLLAREMTEAWITLNCVSNPVGGDLIGNAWWSGVRIADLLDEAGVLPEADAVKQTSHDGWTCGTPIEALVDSRNALLAVGMNGEALPIEHGFPARMVVPGLYGYVSATKWVVDLEVTRFADFTAFWTERGWSPKGPVKMSSRIDVPRSGDEVKAGSLRIGGSAWVQHTGIRAVEFSLDGGAWQQAELGTVPNKDTWVQWEGSVDVEPGEHALRVRAIDVAGEVQTPVVRDVVPDGATGLHVVEFTAS